MKLLLQITAIFCLVCAGGCASDPEIVWNQGTLDTNAVRRVDCSTTPQMKEMADRAREIGNQYYPQVVDLLVENGTKVPRQFDIVFKEHLWRREFGELSETFAYTKPWQRTVYLNADAWRNPDNWPGGDPSMLDAVLIHEMTHVAEQYHSRAHTYWAEGISEYVRYKLGYTNAGFCPECSEDYPHYSSGYACAGAFLLYLDSIYGSDLVRELNTQLRRKSYSDAFFFQRTGRTLQALWGEFQKTSEFKPVAARINQFQKTLGYVDGRPPKDFPARFEAYIQHQPGGPEITAWLDAEKRAGRPIRNAGVLTRMYVYFSEPGGSALSFLVALKKSGKLPGIAKTDHGLTNPSFLNEGLPAAYPAVQTLDFTKIGDASIYHYTVVRAAPAVPWKLERAWRTDDCGNLLHEFSATESR